MISEETRVDHPTPASMIQRMTLVMDAFDHPNHRLGLDDVATRTGLPRTTTRRILVQLVEFRWLERVSTSYRLGQRAFHLGDRWVRQSALRSAAAPHLQRLAIQVEMPVHLAVLERTEVYILDRVGTGLSARVPNLVGRRLPAHCTAAGKAMLAWLEPDEIDLMYAGRMERRTANSIGAVEKLQGELARVRDRRGLAVERGECLAPLGCVGIALPGQSAGIAISVVGDAGDLVPDRIAPLVVATAKKIAAAAGVHR